jgi:hypothetical protein
MYKKAMELNENCGVNVTLVTENEGIYRFYNTSNRSMREVFEGYLEVLQNTPQSFSTEEPVPDEGHGPSPVQMNTGVGGKVLAAVEVCEPDSLLRLFDAAIHLQKMKDSAQRKAARKIALTLKRVENSLLVNAPLCFPHTSPLTCAPTAAKEVTVVSKTNLVGKEAVRRGPGVPAPTLCATVSRHLARCDEPIDTFSGKENIAALVEKKKKKRSRNAEMPTDPCLDEDDEAVTVEKKKKKKNRDVETPMDLCPDEEDETLTVEKKKKKKSKHVEMPMDMYLGEEDEALTVEKKKKKKSKHVEMPMDMCLGEEDEALTVEKKKKKKSKHFEQNIPCTEMVHPVASNDKVCVFRRSHKEDVVTSNVVDEKDCVKVEIKKNKQAVSVDKVNMVTHLAVTTKSARVASVSKTFVDEEDISLWLDGMEQMSMLGNGTSSGVMCGQNDPIFTRFERS